MEDHQTEVIAPQPEPKQVSPKIIIATIGIFTLLAVVIAKLPTKPQTSTATPPTTNSQNYQDGTYSVTGNYISPGGSEEIDVTLTLKDGLVTDAQVEPKAVRPISVKMQADFAANYKPLVIGKKISDLKLDKVSGSSLTPKGFNDAVKKIKAQSQV